MISFPDFEKKLVIPTWLSYADAAKGGELTFPSSRNSFQLNARTRRQFISDYKEFKQSPTPHRAADLMGAAFVVGEMESAKELAHVVEESNGLQKPALDLAAYILRGSATNRILGDIRNRILKNKQFLREFPNDAIGWIQRARLYTILGQIKKAESCIRIAVNLAPGDRYIVRSAVRFFIHAEDPDSAWHYVKRALSLAFDPWIKATEIGVAELVQKQVKKIKHVVGQSATPSEIYHNSELIESIGMLELLHGNDHKAKKNFKQAWLKPSRNVVTHSEWIVRNRFPDLIDLARPNFGESLEASTWQFYTELRIKEAIEAACEWALEEPYSKRPFAIGSSLACTMADYDRAVRIAREGLQANPKDLALQNNLCYSLLKANRMTDAEREFANMPPQTEVRDQIFYSATKGLLEFKRGNFSAGRTSYLDAVEKAVNAGNQTLASKALLNLAIAEVEAEVPGASVTAVTAIKASDRLKLPDIILAREALLVARSLHPEVSVPAQAPAHLLHFNKVNILPSKMLPPAE
jgi:tetratricopeptide (TPR) repeat protein